MPSHPVKYIVNFMPSDTPSPSPPSQWLLAARTGANPEAGSPPRQRHRRPRFFGHRAHRSVQHQRPGARLAAAATAARRSADALDASGRCAQAERLPAARAVHRHADARFGRRGVSGAAAIAHQRRALVAGRCAAGRVAGHRALGVPSAAHRHVCRSAGPAAGLGVRRAVGGIGAVVDVLNGRERTLSE